MATALIISRDRVTARADQRWAGVLLFLLAAQFMTVIMLAASMAPGYALSGGAISDLGVIHETSLLFNLALIGVGLLNLAGGYLYYRSHGRPWIFAAFGVAGVGATGAGLVPLNTGELHSLFALLAFLFFNIEAIACSAILTGPMKPISALAGLVGLAFVVLMVIGDAGNLAVFGVIGHGGAERMIVYPPMLWMLGFGGYLMRGAGADGAIETRPVRATPAGRTAG
jgi:hypothetical membrane protein